MIIYFQGLEFQGQRTRRSQSIQARRPLEVGRWMAKGLCSCYFVSRVRISRSTLDAYAHAIRKKMKNSVTFNASLVSSLMTSWLEVSHRRFSRSGLRCPQDREPTPSEIQSVPNLIWIAQVSRPFSFRCSQSKSHETKTGCTWSQSCYYTLGWTLLRTRQSIWIVSC